ncbi:hypothetical protein O3609_06810 [Veillonella atypica]|mgnify:FL=1|jgi:hypothetical protein|uniref:hypothetical protein n=1 Tax=Veillonella atypica TaxID=39777 RepID=UPI00352EC2CB
MSTADELLARKNAIIKALDNTISSLDDIQKETKRLHSIAINTTNILTDLDEEFSKRTSLGWQDIKFLFAATALQCIRIYVINTLTKVQPAGAGNVKENFLHKIQGKLLGTLNDGVPLSPAPYYAPLMQICTARGVPYDATRFKDINHGFFKEANHRFATFGHDPIVGLIVGTSNILTNTITCRSKGPLPVPITCHVEYDMDLKNPCIGDVCSTIEALKAAAYRIDNDAVSIVAALIKQIIHIGTDLYTPCGIQIPGANLILDNRYAEELTKYVSAGDFIKIGVSYQIFNLINMFISSLHMLTCQSTSHRDKELHHVKTMKILEYSNIIATGSNVIINAVRFYFGDGKALKDIDFAGLIGTIMMLVRNDEIKRKIKREFIFGEYERMVTGDSYDPTESFLLKLPQ